MECTKVKAMVYDENDSRKLSYISVEYFFKLEEKLMQYGVSIFEAPFERIIPTVRLNQG